MDNINNLNSEEELSNSLFIQREYSLHHLVYELEFSFYDAVKSGNIAEVERLMVPLTNQQHGKLSDHPIRNLQYHLVIGIAFITRFCVEGGMEKEIAYSLSDFYIHKADQCSSIKSIDLLHKKMVYDFTKRMHDSKQTKAISLSKIGRAHV